MNNLSDLQAYNAMLYYLELFFLQTKSEDIGDLLSDSEFFWDDNTTADPASWFKWQKAIKGLNNTQQQFTPDQAFDAMINYVKIYRSYWNASLDLDHLIQDLKFIGQSRNFTNPMWQKWLHTINETLQKTNPRMQKHE